MIKKTVNAYNFTLSYQSCWLVTRVTFSWLVTRPPWLVTWLKPSDSSSTSMTYDLAQALWLMTRPPWLMTWLKPSDSWLDLHDLWNLALGLWLVTPPPWLMTWLKHSDSWLDLHDLWNLAQGLWLVTPLPWLMTWLKPSDSWLDLHDLWNLAQGLWLVTPPPWLVTWLKPSDSWLHLHDLWLGSRPLTHDSTSMTCDLAQGLWLMTCDLVQALRFITRPPWLDSKLQQKSNLASTDFIVISMCVCLSLITWTGISLCIRLMALPNCPGICPGVAKLSRRESQRLTALPNCPGVPAYFSQRILVYLATNITLQSYSCFI